MKHLTLTAWLAVLLAVPAAVAGESPDGAWVVRLEAPFVKEQPAWMPLRIDLEIVGGKPVRAVASGIHLNLNWHPVDVTDLRLEAGRLTGSLAVTFQGDDFEKAAIVASADAAKQADRLKDRFSGLPAQAIAVDIPLGTITGPLGTITGPLGTLTGPAPGAATIEKDVLQRDPKPLTVAARAWRPVPAAAGAPRYVEFQILRWDSFQRTGLYDGQQFGALLLRCALLPDGSTRDWICLQGPERYLLQTADLLWSVENARVSLNRGELTGTFDLAPTRAEKLRAAAKDRINPLPEQPLPVRLTARLIGTGVAGTAELAHATPLTSSVLGRIRTQPFARHADRTPRAWAFSAEADPTLVAAAEKEASTPARPGEPGKSGFWSESAMFGGCDIFQFDGKRVVAADRMHGKPWDIEDYEIYRASLISKTHPRSQGSFVGIAPPTFNLPAVPGAARYRFTLDATRAGHPGNYTPVATNYRPDFGTFSVEAPVRHAVPPELWQRVPFTGPLADGRGFPKLTIQALDGAGQNVGEAVSLTMARMPAFQGPYFKALPRTCREAALLSARWMGDNPANTAVRLNHGMNYRGCLHHNGDGQFWYITFSGFYAGLALAQTSPDPAERQYGLDLAITVGESWLRSFLAGYLPDTYKGWAFDQWVYGTAWLDLYRLTGDPRWRELVMEHAKRLCAKQLPSGTWGETDPDRGHVSVDATTGLPQIISIQGPSMQQWDPSSALYYLGRIRKELKTDDFRAAEDKAWQWLQDNSIARFDWRKQGPHASEDHKQPWLTIPDCALHCYEYLALDLPGRTADPALMEDLLRWSEERNVDWRRQTHPTQVFPRILFLSKNRDTQLRLARGCARQAQRTGSRLWKAKAEALAGAMLTAQFPTTGQIPHFPDVDATLVFSPGYSGPGSGDGGNRGEYATLALLDLAELWEPAKP